MIVAALIAAVAADRAAYPIPPEPLRQLVQESQLIVTSTVRAWRTEDGTDAGRPRWGDDIPTGEANDGDVPPLVTLEVGEKLKGDPGAKPLVLRNEILVTCPAPARYVVGSTVLAFLDGDAKRGFTTHALSYGSKALNKDELALYVSRVKMQLAIDALEDGPEKLTKQVEWLVACAEQPATRWEGAYDLDESRRAAAAATEDAAKDAETKRADFFRQLTLEQRQRLLTSLIAARNDRPAPAKRRRDIDDCDENDAVECLARLLCRAVDPRIVDGIVERLRALASGAANPADGEPGDLVAALARLDPRPGVRLAVAKFQAADSGLDSVERRQQRAAALQALLALYP